MMNVAELSTIARRSGISDLQVFGSEKQLVWAIQRARGEDACFLGDTRFQCRDSECEWRDKCRRLVAEWRR